MAESREHGTVTWSEFDEVLRVKMCSPPINELDAHLVCMLSAALDAFARSSARVLIIVSGVAQYFATSGAPNHTVADPNPCEHTSTGLHEVCGRLVNGDRPSIAVVEGFALDGGLKLALACTARVGTAVAQMGLRRHQVGPVTGKRAHEIGLLDQLAEPGRTQYEALKFAAALKSPLGPAVTEVLRRVDEAFDTSAEPRENHEQRQARSLLEGPGARGRLRTFLRLRRAQAD